MVIITLIIILYLCSKKRALWYHLCMAKEVVERYGLGAPRTITLNKKTLIKRDIIEVNGDGYQFVDPICALWFKREYM